MVQELLTKRIIDYSILNIIELLLVIFIALIIICLLIGIYRAVREAIDELDKED